MNSVRKERKSLPEFLRVINPTRVEISAMKWTFVIQILALLTASTGIVTGDFWDDLADTVQDIVDDNVGEDTGIDLDAGGEILEDILDEARDFLDDTILPGGNIGGDENSVFGEGFTPVEAETSNKDDDLEALLDQLQGIADRIGELLVADGTFSQNDIREIVDAFDSREEEDEVSEVLLTAILEYILEELGVDVSDDLVEEKLVPLIIDVYNIVKDYISNATSSGNTKELQLLEDVLDSLVDNMFPNMTMEDILCNAASNGIENFVEQSTNLERDNQKTFVRNVALLLLGCQEEEIKRINPDEGGRLRDIFMASSNGSLIEQVLEMLSTEPARNILTETFFSLLADRSTNFTLFNNPFLSAMIDSRPFFLNIFNNGSRNRRDQGRFGDVLENFGNFENLRDLFESLGEKRDSVDDQTPTTFIPNTSPKEDKSSTARPTVTTTTTAKTITRLLSSSTTSTVTATATTTAKTARTTTVQSNITATTATTSPGSFPFMMRRERFREFRSNFQEAVSNATERLAQLVREEINNSQLAQLIYTLLNSDLVREVLQALDISFIPLQTTSMTITTPKRDAISRNSTGVFSTNDADIDRLSSDSEPVARAMTQTTIQILQTANLSDPESIVSTAGQVLLDNARQTLQDEVLSDPLAFVRDVVDFVSRNNSLLSRIIPQETMAVITDGIG